MLVALCTHTPPHPLCPAALLSSRLPTCSKRMRPASCFEKSRARLQVCLLKKCRHPLGWKKWFQMAVYATSQCYIGPMARINLGQASQPHLPTEERKCDRPDCPPRQSSWEQACILPPQSGQMLMHPRDWCFVHHADAVATAPLRQHTRRRATLDSPPRPSRLNGPKRN